MRVSLSRVKSSVPDILAGMDFELIFGSIPGTPNTEHLTVRSQTATIPGSSHEVIQVPLHGHTLNYRGRRIFPYTMSVQFVDAVDHRTFDSMHRWLENVVGTESATSFDYKAGYTTNAELIVYDVRGILVNSYTIFNIMIQDITDTQLDGQSSQAVQVQAQFQYDNWRSRRVAWR